MCCKFNTLGPFESLKIFEVVYKSRRCYLLVLHVLSDLYVNIMHLLRDIGGIAWI